MTEAEFDALAAGLPEATYAPHHGEGAWKVGGKIFAGPAATRGGRGIVKLTPEQQEMLCSAEPWVFQAPNGYWGRQGWTDVIVAAADEPTARSALWMAWRNVAPKSIAKRHP